MKIMIIEDDQQIIDVVAITFQICLPEVQLVSAQEGEQGIKMVEIEKPDVVILDLGLPDISGYDVLKSIRLFSNVPVLILTVRSDETDTVKGLELGADDYMTKPFRQLELIARVRSLLRRQSPIAEEQPLTYGQLSFNPANFQLIDGEKEINLTRTEGIILHQLMKHPGQVVDHSALAEAIWGEDCPDSERSVKVYIHRLREKLETDPSHPQRILTRSGKGYLLTKPKQDQIPN